MTQSDAPRLIYLFDPLCGWCYGAGPGLARVAATGIAIEMIPTGLFAGTGREMDAGFAEYAWTNDQRIAQMTGVSFTQTYREQVLAAGGAFDSATATFAVVAAGGPHDPARITALKALQEGRYVSGRSLDTVESVAAILRDAGLEAGAARIEAMDEALIEETQGELSRGQDLMQALQARGVPTLAMVRGDRLAALSSDLLFDADLDLGAILSELSEAIAQG